MKQLLTKSSFILGLLFLLITCAEKKEHTNAVVSEESKQSASSTMGNSYEPGSGWTLDWSDEFDGEIIDSANWNYQVEEAGRFNDEWQRYTNSSENAYVEDGSLVIKAIHESETHGMNQYTSARLTTANKQTWKYGKIAAKIKLPYSEGIWPAFWMLGANINENGGDTPWPQCGEIDILELYGSKDDAVVEGNLHFANEDNNHEMMGAEAYELEEGKFADNYHIFELEWDADEISWLVDGDEYHSASITSEELTEFHKEFFILFNVAVGGAFAGRPDASSVFPQYMLVDWIRVYKKQI